MKRALIVMSVLIVVWSLQAAADGSIQRVRYWGGDQPAEQLTVVNGHAFFGGETVRVADLTDPTAPVVVNEYRLNAVATDIDAHGDRVYAVDDGDELLVIDASAPHVSRPEGRFLIDGGGWHLRQVAFNGDAGIITGQTISTGYMTRLFVVDVSGAEPEPVILGSVVVDGVVEHLALGNRLAVVSTDEDRLVFVDVSDPTAPVVVHDVAASSYVGAGRVSDLEARGDVLAIGDTEAKVTVMSIENPDNIRYLGLVFGLNIGVPSLGFEGEYLHVGGGACSPQGICGGYALIEVPVPGAPRLLARMDGPWLAAPVAHEGFVIAAGHQAGLRVVDPGSDDDPILLDVMFPEREVGAFASAGQLVHAVDTTSFLAAEDPDRNRLAVLEKRPDGVLDEMGAYQPEGKIWAVAGDNVHAAVAQYDEATEFHALEVLDVSDPTAPTRGSRIGAQISIEHDTLQPHLRSKGDFLYFSVADSDDVVIHEVNRGRADQKGIYSPGGEMVNFAPLTTDLLAVAVRNGDTGWVDVVDTSALPGLTVAASYQLPAEVGVPLTLDGDGTQVVVLCEAQGLLDTLLLDVSDPANPNRVDVGLLAGRWLALGDGLLHSQLLANPVTSERHSVWDIADPADTVVFQDIGPMDVERNRAQADGASFCVSRGRLEIYDYRTIEPVDVVPDDVLPLNE